MIRVVILSTVLATIGCNESSNFEGDSTESRPNVFEEEDTTRDPDSDLIAEESRFVNPYYDAAVAEAWDQSASRDMPDKLYVMNGDEVEAADYPFMASLQSENYKHCCGGSIVSSYLILTAAHCLWLARCPITQVQLTKNGLPRSANYRVMYRIPHPKYDDENHVHDIALLVLDRRIPGAQSVELMARGWRVRAGSTSYALGWGKTEFRFESKKLRRADLPVIPEEHCFKYYKKPGYWICTDSRYKDVCNGDSGGPLMVDQFQVGVISMGKGCLSGKPTVFTNVGAYRKWIDKYILYYDGQI